MVYRGKPSSACEPCRKRRAKCDEKKPGCSQCARKSIKCPGYRNLSDLYFQDETQAVLRKHKKAIDGSRESPAESWGARLVEQHGGGSPNSGSPLADTAQAPPVSCAPVRSPLAFPVEDQASAFFANAYLPTSPFDYLERHGFLLFLDSRSPSDPSPLPAAIQATALATLSIARPSPSITRAAHANYATALRAINRALASPTHAVSDSTLLSVHLLSLFETIVFRGRDSPTSWTAHVHGAVALLRLRGVAQLTTPVGQELYFQTTAAISTSCVMRGEPIPDSAIALDAHLPPGITNHPRFRMNQLIGRLAKLRMVIRNGVSAGPDAIKLLREAVIMEAAFEQLWLDITREFRDIPPEYTRGPGQRFESHMVARAWTSTALVRLFLNEKLWLSCSRFLTRNKQAGMRLLDRELVAELEKIRDNADARGQELILDSLAVVPYFWDPKSERPDKGFTARLLIWPLSVVAQSELCSAEARECALDVLRKMGEGPSLPQAAEAAKMLEEGLMPEDWLHLWHLS